MKIEQEILINQYGQGVVGIGQLISLFETFGGDSKRLFLNEMLFFIMQSKPENEDVELAIVSSKLKSTYTPCVLLKKGVESNRLKKIIELPDNEIDKVFILFLSLFKVAYSRRFKLEKDNSDKWWYWDLSDNKKVNTIIFEYNKKK